MIITVQKIVILGSTGSIGTQTLEVIRHLGGIEVLGLTANENIALLKEQIEEFHPVLVAVAKEEKGEMLRKELGAKVKVVTGEKGLLEAASMDKADMVVTAVVGNAGIAPTFAAIEAGKNIALANKETLVSAGALIMDAAKKHGVSIYPVDSEHSAIFQCLQGNRENPIKRILLTASGGAMRGKTKKELLNASVKQVLSHPNWNMGKKVTVDSATLMNKGLEVIEAKWLFGVDLKQIEVVIHPQSIIHSAVEYEDGAVMAQLGMPDMRIPIQYALSYPKRIAAPYPRIDFTKTRELTFESPDTEVFRCLSLAYEAVEMGGTMPAVLNGANEAAVSRFLQGEISFLEIPRLIETAMHAYTVKKVFEMEDLLIADKWAKEFALGLQREHLQ